MTPEHRRLIERIRSSAQVLRRAVDEAPRSRFDEMLFGSTLRGVVRRASCPVLVVPVIAGAHEWIVSATS